MLSKDTKTTNKTKAIMVRLNEIAYDKLYEIYKREGYNSIQEVIRQAIREFTDIKEGGN